MAANSVQRVIGRRTNGRRHLHSIAVTCGCYRGLSRLQISVLSLLVAVSSAARRADSGTLPAYRCTNLFALTVPSGYYIDSVTGITADGSQVVGIEGQFQSGFSYAMVWNNPTSLGINLNPSNSNSSAALATDGQLQVGAANKPGPNEEYPVVWSGTANSGVYLSPPSYLGEANGVAGNQIVGFIETLSLGNQAMLWTGSNYAPTDLQPSSATYYGSDALASDGFRQVGYADTTNNGTAVTHAMLWDGTANSAIDLNPTTTTFSQALGIDGAEQVGIGLFGNNYHAMLWAGSASSAVDLNPSNYAASEAVSTNGIYQIGYADQGYGAADDAIVWDGTAASALDLSSLVPGSVGNSQALAIDANGDIFGYAGETGGIYAVEWSVVPEPAQTGLFMVLGFSLLGRQSRRRRRTS